jgi:hypothetical protein
MAGATIQQAVARLAARHARVIADLAPHNTRAVLAAELHQLVQNDVWDELEAVDALVTGIVTAALAETDWWAVLDAVLAEV